MGTLHQNRNGVPAEIKGAKLTKGECVSVYKGNLMIMKWENKNNMYLVGITHYDKMFPSGV
jgi:hypothetical protein